MKARVKEHTSMIGAFRHIERQNKIQLQDAAKKSIKKIFQTKEKDTVICSIDYKCPLCGDKHGYDRLSAQKRDTIAKIKKEGAIEIICPFCMEYYVGKLKLKFGHLTADDYVEVFKLIRKLENQRKRDHDANKKKGETNEMDKITKRV